MVSQHFVLKDNGSGYGRTTAVPEEIQKWSWGAFILSWIWGIGNGSWIALLALIPWVGLVVAVYLGFNGNKLAWSN